MAYVIENVEALWPRLDRTYKFDQRENGGKGGSVPCAPSDQGAAYDLSFKMTKDQATKLYQDMAAEFAKAKQPGWDEKLAMPFKKSEDGIFFIGKDQLKRTSILSSGKPAHRFKWTPRRTKCQRIFS